MDKLYAIQLKLVQKLFRKNIFVTEAETPYQSEHFLFDCLSLMNKKELLQAWF